MSYNYLPLDSKPLSFEQVKNLLQYQQHLSVTFDAHKKITTCRNYLDELLTNNTKLYYGINTGFGFLQDVAINAEQVEQLQTNLLKSHACGLGEFVPAPVIKLMIAFKIKSLSYGYSGVHIETVKRLTDFYNNDVLPVIYTQGSLGASGDLAPLSHLSLPLIGMGEVWYKEERRKTEEVWPELGWAALQLKSKEGLALINGTQFMSAYGMYTLIQCNRLMQWANLIAAISLDAFNGSLEAFHEAIHAIRPHTGQVEVAKHIRAYLKGSEISPASAARVQDPYSFRCVPQVHGATMDTIDYVKSVFLKEVNAVTDNPNVFAADKMILSGGNFHGQPLALTLDFLSIAMSELANISERRIYQLIGGQRGLPLFLVKNPGLHSGFMIPQYTAAGIVSENKQLSTPASVDSISSSNNQEDHVSMGANAATKCLRIVENVEKVLAIELLTAMQALEFRRPLRSSSFIEEMFQAFRQKISFNTEDRVLHNDIRLAIEFIKEDPAVITSNH